MKAKNPYIRDALVVAIVGAVSVLLLSLVYFMFEFARSSFAAAAVVGLPYAPLLFGLSALLYLFSLYACGHAIILATVLLIRNSGYSKRDAVIEHYARFLIRTRIFAVIGKLILDD